ncbi:hypothetical protein BX600DRAFT_371527, partial [Xylariales sp. PMI_506]
VSIPTDVNLTELLNSSGTVPGLADSHVIAADNFQNRTITIGELRDTAGRLAHGLASTYCPKDESRWAIILPNGITFMEAVHAVLWQNGVFCPVNHELQANEIGYVLSVCRPDYAIVWSESVSKVTDAFKVTRELNPEFKTPEIIVAAGSVAGYPSLDSFRSSRRLDISHHADTTNRLASIHTSSGTTGMPKGVGLTHYNYVANVIQCVTHDPAHWTPTNSSLCFSPMVHIANTTLPLFLGPYVGHKHVIMAKFDGDAFCELAQNHRVTEMPLPTPIVSRVLSGEMTRKYDLSSVKCLTSFTRFKQESLDQLFSLQDWSLVNLFGMTEAAPYVAWSKLGKTPPAGQIGTLVPNMEARLCDPDGKDVPIGSAGELWLRGPNMTNGYVDNPEANASAFKEGGWYNSGDLCTFSSDGNLAVVGRTKELFKSSGFQVSPQELESYLLGHPGIAEVSVGPTYDKRKSTDVATAYVVLNSNLTTEAEKLAALKDIGSYLDGKVSGYKKLKGGVWEVTHFVKNGTGKIMRNHISEHSTGLC